MAYTGIQAVDLVSGNIRTPHTATKGGPMAAPASVDEFLDLVRKSGVIDEKRLDAYLHRARAGLPNDVTQSAEVLVRDGLLTLFQKENILAGRWRRFFIGK